MKKNLVLILLILCTSLIYSQKCSAENRESKETVESRKNLYNMWHPSKTKPYIVHDEINSYNIRYVDTSFRMIKAIESKGIFVGIKGYNDNNMYLTVLVNSTEKLHIRRGSPMLIKTTDDEVITLYCNKGGDDESGYYYYIGDMQFTAYKVTVDYKINANFIDKISKGIKKIRFEINMDICDRTIKKDNISKFLFECYSLVLERLSQERNFTTDF